jgi:hypothetical protein
MFPSRRLNLSHLSRCKCFNITIKRRPISSAIAHSVHTFILHIPRQHIHDLEKRIRCPVLPLCLVDVVSLSSTWLGPLMPTPAAFDCKPCDQVVVAGGMQACACHLILQGRVDGFALAQTLRLKTNICARGARRMNSRRRATRHQHTKLNLACAIGLYPFACWLLQGHRVHQRPQGDGLAQRKQNARLDQRPGHLEMFSNLQG